MKNIYPHILQTPEWGKAKSFAHPYWKSKFIVKFKEKESTEILTEIKNWSQVQWSVLILERNLPFGQKMQYVPRGPFVDWTNRDSVTAVLNLLKSESQNSNVLFIRFEPNIFDTDFPYDLIKELGFNQTEDYVQAHDTIKINLDGDEDDLLNSFHKKTRYNIRLAERRGLTVRSSVDPNDVSLFYQLTQKTDNRKSGAMNPHSEKYYQEVVKMLGEFDMAKVYIVEKEGIPISASIDFFFGNEAIYMFGASDYEYRRDMPNHLREWTAITDAQKLGFETFDLWGATMRNDPGEGIKRYKLGYNETILNYAGTFDYAPNKFKYKIFNLINKLRRLF